MPLHIFRVNRKSWNRSKPVSMSFDLLQEVQPALEAFRRDTGIRISEYDDAKLSSEQLGSLLDLILSKNPEIREDKEVQKLISLNQEKCHDSYFIAQGE